MIDALAEVPITLKAIQDLPPDSEIACAGTAYRGCGFASLALPNGDRRVSETPAKIP